MNVILWDLDTVQWLVPNVTVILTAKVLQEHIWTTAAIETLSHPKLAQVLKNQTMAVCTDSCRQVVQLKLTVGSQS